MADVEVRRVEKTYGETGVGQSDRVEAAYELGAEIEGAWVPFARVTEAFVLARQSHEQAAQPQQANEPASAAAPAPAPTSAPPSATGATTGTAPNEQTTAV